MFKYIRIKIFYSFLKPAQNYFRSLRMIKFLKLMGKISPGTEIIDLGGQPQIWHFIPVRLNITIVNLPGIAKSNYQSTHNIRYVEGDACNLNMFKDKEYEIAFSNSVIEHVGDDVKVKSFAMEAQRVARNIWIQTPSKFFPLEPHTGMFFWWYYPSIVKNLFLNRWSKKLPAWTEMIRGTRYITKSQLRDLFPECQICTERFLGIPKSYIVYSKNL